jgi:hypothetical protein
VAKDRRPGECRCDGAGDRRAALVGVGKEAVSANQVGDHYDQRVGSHQIAKINHRPTATTINALVSTMQGVGLTKGKYKIHGRNVERKGCWGRKSAQQEWEVEATILHALHRPRTE